MMAPSLPDRADEVLARLDEVACEVEQKLGDVQDDVRRLEPRLETVESEARRIKHLVEGNPERLLPSGERDRGLAGDVYDHGQVIQQVDRAITVAKWVAGLFGTATAALVANLVANIL